MLDNSYQKSFSFGFGVCLIRFDYTIQAITSIDKIMDAILKKEDISCLPEKKYFDIKFLEYCSKATFKNVDVYGFCVSQKICLEKDKVFREDDNRNFYVKENKYFIFEIKFGENNDESNFRFLYMLGDYLNKLDLSYEVRVFNKIEKNTYSSIISKDYFRIRPFFLLGQLNNNFFALRTWKKIDKTKNIVKEETAWVRFYDENDLKKRLAEIKVNEKGDEKDAFVNIGRIAPLIVINKETFTIMQNMIKDDSPDDEYGMLQLVRKYESMLEDKIDEIKQIVNEDNYLETLLFYILYSYINVVEKEDIGDIMLLHEQCMDCAQGIIQTTENALFHVVWDESEINQGCATLVIRVRKAEKAKYLTEKAKKLKANYYLEVYVTDFCYDLEKNIGIVDKFIENAQDRYSKITPSEQEKWKNFCGNPYDWNNNPGEKEIKLEDMFTGGEESSIYNKYLSLPQVIAFHYGLQIFNNSIMSNNGYLGVWSKEYYSSNSLDLYIDNKIDNWRGTAYIIYIPIMYEESSINYEDTLENNNVIKGNNSNNFKILYSSNSNGEDYISILNNYVEGDYNVLKEKKNEYVSKLNECLKLDEIASGDDTVYVVDCSGINDTCTYEILAKNLFIKLATEEKISNIALINLKNKNEVIKMFRQFALFYNREGKNNMMHEKKKSIFIVDNCAELDIAFGGRIDEIINHMQTQLVWGGIGEKIKKIVYHLGGQKNE